jgi:uncharacterized protein YndB with AHSA1/START domain
MSKKLVVTTPSDTEVQMTREFDAPRPMVWKAMTKPEYIKRWCYGFPGWSLSRCEDDQRPGGQFVWEWTGPNGEFMQIHGENIEFVPPERGVRTETFVMGGMDCPPMGTQTVTMTLKDLGDRTHLTIHLAYDSKEARDGAIASGMDDGMNMSYDRLDAILAEG